MNGDPPIDDAAMDRSIKEHCDQATREHEQITPPPFAGFAANDSIAERQDDLFARLTEICPGGDGTAREIMYAVELMARRIAIDMLASNEGIRRLHIFSEAFLESDEMTRRLFRANKLFFDGAEFHQRVMDIAWPALSDERRDQLIQIVDIAERGKTRADAERQCDHEWMDVRDEAAAHKQVCVKCSAIRDAERRPPECDHQWVQNEDVETGRTCRNCGVVDACAIAPADVPEEIIEIDEAGKVTAVESTVHTEPANPRAEAEAEKQAAQAAKDIHAATDPPKPLHVKEAEYRAEHP